METDESRLEEAAKRVAMIVTSNPEALASIGAGLMKLSEKTVAAAADGDRQERAEQMIAWEDPVSGAQVGPDGLVIRPPSPDTPLEAFIGPSGATEAISRTMSRRDGAKAPSYYRGGRPKLTTARLAARREQERRAKP